MAKAISEEQKIKMRKLAEAGHTAKEIAALCGVCAGTVTLYAGGSYAGKSCGNKGKTSRGNKGKTFPKDWAEEFTRQWEEMRKLFNCKRSKAE